jgi:hypothetical protein
MRLAGIDPCRSLVLLLSFTRCPLVSHDRFPSVSLLPK